MIDELTRPIVGIENRTAQEVFDIMAARIQRSALSPGSADETEGWRDIESAPKDWTDVFLYDPNYDNDFRKVFEGYFDDIAQRWRDSRNDPFNPTHWRPLPAPPSAMLSAAGER